MPFRTHLIIIACIIAAVYFAWHIIDAAPPPPPPAAVEVDSPYSIAIAHASWGLNCRRDENSDGFAADKTALREDNVLAALAERCNGKLRCDIPLTPETMGDTPTPGCTKQLVVEYRCFSFDRPWTVRASSGKLSINCDRPVKAQ